MIFRYAEIFSGAGGLALGAKTASFVDASGEEWGITPVWSLDSDADACETYRRNIGDHAVCADARTYDWSEMPAFDGLGFGFPCNDFSLVGEHKGLHGEFGPLYSYAVKAIQAHNPLWFVAENVDGLSSANKGEALTKIVSALEQAGASGYRTFKHAYKFEEYGVPQNRHRIIIVGIRGDVPKHFVVPAPTAKGAFVTSKAAICSPPIPAGAPNHEMPRHNDLVIRRLKHIPPGKNVWCEELPQELRWKVKKKATISQCYRRLDPDKPSYTVIANGGGGTHVYHWSEARALTNRERARLQTFPDDFVFSGSVGSARRQIGMAVPPLAARQVFEALLRSFASVCQEDGGLFCGVES